MRLTIAITITLTINNNDGHNNRYQIGVTDVSSFGVSVSIESFPQGEPARNWLGMYMCLHSELNLNFAVLLHF